MYVHISLREKETEGGEERKKEKESIFTINMYILRGILKINVTIETYLCIKTSNLKARAKCGDACWIDTGIRGFLNLSAIMFRGIY